MPTSSARFDLARTSDQLEEIGREAKTKDEQQRL